MRSSGRLSHSTECAPSTHACSPRMAEPFIEALAEVGHGDLACRLGPARMALETTDSALLQCAKSGRLRRGSADAHLGRAGSAHDGVTPTFAPPGRCGSGQRTSRVLGCRPRQASRERDRSRAHPGGSGSAGSSDRQRRAGSGLQLRCWTPRAARGCRSALMSRGPAGKKSCGRPAARDRCMGHPCRALDADETARRSIRSRARAPGWRRPGPRSCAHLAKPHSGHP